MSRLPDLSTTSVLDLSGETNFIASAAKAEATVRRKARKREIFIACRASVLWTRKIGYGKMKNSLISRTCIMKPKDFLRSVILIVALSAFGISSGVASDKNEAKHSSKITKARAERIALTKVPGGSVRSAELETARGRRFWSVYNCEARIEKR